MKTYFKALIPFAYQDKIFNVNNDEPYTIENADIIKSWEVAGYCKIVEIGTGVANIENKILAENVQIDQQDVLDSLKGLTYKELKERAKNAGINGYQNMKREALEEALKEVE